MFTARSSSVARPLGRIGGSRKIGGQGPGREVYRRKSRIRSAHAVRTPPVRWCGRAVSRRSPNGQFVPAVACAADCDYHRCPRFVVTRDAGRRASRSHVERKPPAPSDTGFAVRAAPLTHLGVEIAAQHDRIRPHRNAVRSGWHPVGGPLRQSPVPRCAAPPSRGPPKTRSEGPRAGRRAPPAREGRLHAAGAFEHLAGRWSLNRRRARVAGRAGGADRCRTAARTGARQPRRHPALARWVQASAPDPESIERAVLDGLDRALAELAGCANAKAAASRR